MLLFISLAASKTECSCFCALLSNSQCLGRQYCDEEIWDNSIQTCFPASESRLKVVFLLFKHSLITVVDYIVFLHPSPQNMPDKDMFKRCGYKFFIKLYCPFYCLDPFSLDKIWRNTLGRSTVTEQTHRQTLMCALTLPVETGRTWKLETKNQDGTTHCATVQPCVKLLHIGNKETKLKKSDAMLWYHKPAWP